MKDWNADYKRHVTLGNSVGNIKGFSDHERLLLITHGYGHFMPIQAREIYVRDERVFCLDWVEQAAQDKLDEFAVNTAKLTAGANGVSHQVLSDYLDRHIDSGFDHFVNSYFEGTPFITGILITAYHYWLNARVPVIRKALKLVLAYNLTQHVTMVGGVPVEEGFEGLVRDPKSKWNGQTIAPVMINFQIKCAMADMWRELQREILEELSSLYSSVYGKDKLKNWPTIFLLATILLTVWEEMQFDSHYKVQVSTSSSNCKHDTDVYRMSLLSTSSVPTWRPHQSASSLVSSKLSQRSFRPSVNGTTESTICCYIRILLYATQWTKSRAMSSSMVGSLLVFRMDQ